MRKFQLHELGRMSLAEHRLSAKIPVVLVLDNVRSQHNIGSIFRTADAFRFEAVYLCGITATPPSREMQKTALGATESVQWKYYKDTLIAINDLRKSKYAICAIEQAEGSKPLNLYEFPEVGGLALIFGNEVEGVSQKILDLCDICIEIPQHGTKHSLNVAVSAGIVAWDVFNKFLKNNPGILKSEAAGQ